MRIAHISDLHLLGERALSPGRLVGKRFTGWVNLKLRRGHCHKLDVARKVGRELCAHGVDHVVITGDLTNLALEEEFELVRDFVERDVGLDPERVSLIPGNHDAYTQGAHRSRRFERYFGAYITSDLPGASGVPGVGRFPYVRLRGPVAFVGLSTAVPSPPMFAFGEIGAAQRMALHSLLAHREVKKRFVVILQHHPWHNPSNAHRRLFEGLRDADAERDVLRVLGRGMLLHGHKHLRIHRTIGTDRGHIDAIGSTSASLLDEHPDRVAGFNLYDVDDHGRLVDVSAFRYAHGAFERAEVPRA